MANYDFIKESSEECDFTLGDGLCMKKPYPVIVFVQKGDGGLDKDSVVQCDQIKSLDKFRIVRKRGHFTTDIMRKVDVALKNSLALS